MTRRSGRGIVFACVMVCLMLGGWPNMVYSTNADPAQEVRQMFEQASLAFQQGDLSEAEGLFAQLVKMLPMLSAPLLNLAIVYEKRNELKMARDAFKKARTKFPKDFAVAIASCRFGANLMNQKQYDAVKREDVVSACLAATKLNPDDLEAFLMLGSTYVLLMDFEKAIPTLEKAESMAQRPSIAHHQITTNLALAALRGGFAAIALERAAALGQEYGTLRGTQGTIAGVRSILLPYDKEAINLMTSALKQFVNGFNLKDSSCPTGKWGIHTNWTVAASSLKQVAAQAINQVPMGTPYGKRTVHYIGAPLAKYLTEFHERRIDLLTLRDAYMWGSLGLVSTRCVFHTGSQTWNFEVQELAGNTTYLQTVEMPGAFVSALPLKNYNNYYHWVLESMIRVLYIEEYVLDVPGNEHYKLIVPSRSIKHVDGFLKLLHIEPERMVEFQMLPNQRWHLPDGVKLVDWTAPKSDKFGSLMSDPWSSFYPPRQGLQKLRKRLQDSLLEYDPDYADRPKHLVFISRSQSEAVRSISNEPALLAKVRAVAHPLEVVVHTGKEPIHEQLMMFVNAKVVLGAHGAGLSNVIMCNPRTPVILLPMQPHVDHTFGHLFSALDLEEWVVTSVTSYYYGQYGTLSKTQITDVSRAVSEAIEWISNLSTRDEL
eukprot:m.334329 g.334329  ORF g.334329 m.334329 type:complete len:657 (+) comp16070_c1_seq3:973-2943(+)